MLAQAQKMQQDMQNVQAALADKKVTGSAGGGRVTVEATAAGEVVSLKIDPAIVDPGDVAFLQDLVLAAVKDALEKAKHVAAADMRGITAGLPLPPGMGF